MNAERVLILTTSYPEQAGDPSGHFVAAEAEHLARAGHDVQVIAPGAHRVVRGIRVLGVPSRGAFGWPGALARLKESPLRALGAFSFARAARRMLAETAHDRLIAHWLLPAAWPIALASRAPLEVVAHGSDVRLFARLPRPLRRRIAGDLRARQASLRCVSSELAHALEDCGLSSRVEPARIDVSGVPAREACRAALGIAPEERLLVIASRLVPEKRVDVSLGAAALVPGATLVVLGDGPEASALARAFPAARFLGRVPRDRALTWIGAADLVLTASRHEGAPTVVREARALGVSVVSVAAGDLAAWAARDPGLWLAGRCRAASLGR